MYLRKMNKNDIRDIHSYASIPEVSQFQPWGPNCYEDTVAHINTVLKSKNDLFHRVIVEDGKVIGAVELQINFEKNTAEIGYIVHPAYWGKGVSTHAVRIILDVAFNEMNLSKIIGKADVRNTGSIKVLEKT